MGSGAITEVTDSTTDVTSGGKLLLKLSGLLVFRIVRWQAAEFFLEALCEI